MTDATSTEIQSMSGALGRAARSYFGSRRGLIVLALAALASGVALNWSWLVAAGVAPILLAVAPCAVMCALGLCMSKMTGRSCSTESSIKRPTNITSDAPQAAPKFPLPNERN